MESHRNRKRNHTNIIQNIHLIQSKIIRKNKHKIDNIENQVLNGFKIVGVMKFCSSDDIIDVFSLQLEIIKIHTGDNTPEGIHRSVLGQMIAPIYCIMKRTYSYKRGNSPLTYRYGESMCLLISLRS